MGKKEMAKVTSMKAEAKAAEKNFEASVKKSAEEQKQADKEAAEADKKDEAMHECATDGSECQDKKTLKCKKINKKKGPWMANDLVSCTMTKPSKQAYAGEAWAGIPPPLPKTPLPKASKKCKALKAAFLKTKFGGILAKTEMPPFQAVACSKITDYVAKKKAFLDVFALAEACPPWCVPGSSTSDGFASDANGICVPAEDVAMFRQQIEDLPVYKKMGTNGKIPAGPPGDLCRMAKSFAAGFGAGITEAPTPAPTAAPTKA